ncbi:hypothetical protein B0T24DRAFT_677032 [Lasiosphaeria ovina]|uniref:Uncharacterized protein n=1 Tax=Lasiosphaeria ovina TaxID=92902 RepID=A0AAE0NAI7_9PEZI|nr:hypothetical protein B0T24DRAFT_677032 [Lasiosphaeria ovina]
MILRNLTSTTAPPNPALTTNWLEIDRPAPSNPAQAALACYATPYGVVGVVLRLLSIYCIGMLYRRRQTIHPLGDHRLKKKKLDYTLTGVGLGLSAYHLVATLVRCSTPSGLVFLGASNLLFALAWAWTSLYAAHSIGHDSPPAPAEELPARTTWPSASSSSSPNRHRRRHERIGFAFPLIILWSVGVVLAVAGVAMFIAYMQVDHGGSGAPPVLGPIVHDKRLVTLSAVFGVVAMILVVVVAAWLRSRDRTEKWGCWRAAAVVFNVLVPLYTDAVLAIVSGNAAGFQVCTTAHGVGVGVVLCVLFYLGQALMCFQI